MGPKIYFGNAAALRDRCQVAEVEVSGRATGHEARALVPADTWAPLSDDQAASLRVDSQTMTGQAVELVAPSKRYVEGAQRALTERGAKLPFSDESHVEFRGFATSDRNTLTATFNPSSGRYLGIHLDNWDRLTCEKRLLSRRRLCINLGPGPRYLLIGSVDALSICETLYPGDPGRFPHTNDVRGYVEAGHRLMCFRLLINPGEGYVAPTELLPHDGSTAGLDNPSTAAFWLAHWSFGDFPSLV